MYWKATTLISSLLFVAGAARAEDSFDLGPSPDLPAPSYLFADNPSAPPPASPRLRSYELPPVNVVGQKLSDLREEDRVGSYGQPRWTATRRFPNTRVYVVPEGKLEGELWFIPRFNKDGSTEGRYLAEIEYGLPHRFQIDVYYRLDIDKAGSDPELVKKLQSPKTFEDAKSAINSVPGLKITLDPEISITFMPK